MGLLVDSNESKVNSNCQFHKSGIEDYNDSDDDDGNDNNDDKDGNDSDDEED